MDKNKLYVHKEKTFLVTRSGVSIAKLTMEPPNHFMMGVLDHNNGYVSSLYYDNYNENLTHKTNHELDIVTVISEDGELIWEEPKQRKFNHQESVIRNAIFKKESIIAQKEKIINLLLSDIENLNKENQRLEIAIKRKSLLDEEALASIKFGAAANGNRISEMMEIYLK